MTYLNEFLLIANNAKMHAEEVRTIGESMTFETTKQVMYRIAEAYEKQAIQYTKLAERYDNGRVSQRG